MGSSSGLITIVVMTLYLQENGECDCELLQNGGALWRIDLHLVINAGWIDGLCTMALPDNKIACCIDFFGDTLTFSPLNVPYYCVSIKYASFITEVGLLGRYLWAFD